MADGIFCLEAASWEKNSDLTKGRTSLEYFLRFLEVSSGGKVPHRHYDVATEAEIEFYLKEWNKKGTRDKFPVLMLAFHGNENNSLALPDKSEFTTDDLVKHLRNEEDNDAIIHFSSCYSSVKDDRMKDLLKETGTLSVSGYDREVDWYQSAAFELLFLAGLFSIGSEEPRERGLLPDGSVDMRDFVIGNYKQNAAMVDLGEVLGFHMWYDVRDSKIVPREEHPLNITPCKKEDF